MLNCVSLFEIKDADGTVLPGATYKMAPCNLGFCEPHGGDNKREFKVKLIVELPDKSKTEKEVLVTGTMTQEEIVASVAGDTGGNDSIALRKCLPSGMKLNRRTFKLYIRNKTGGVLPHQTTATTRRPD